MKNEVIMKIMTSNEKSDDREKNLIQFSQKLLSDIAREKGFPEVVTFLASH